MFEKKKVRIFKDGGVRMVVTWMYFPPFDIGAYSASPVACEPQKL
jgi:hypothetical protein